jgi:cell division septation protein DedD
MRQLPPVEQAMGRQSLALVRQLDAACTSAADIEAAAIESFSQHPDAEIITSFPGLGPLTDARVLAEPGDDQSRFQDAKGLKAYAGAAPITRASGKADRSRTAGSRTTGSPPPATAGHSPPSSPRPVPAPTTTGAKTPATGTPPPSATSSTGSSAASTTAWPPASTTPKPPHSPLRHTPSQPDNTNIHQLLDNLTARMSWSLALGGQARQSGEGQDHDLASPYGRHTAGRAAQVRREFAEIGFAGHSVRQSDTTGLILSRAL